MSGLLKIFQSTEKPVESASDKDLAARVMSTRQAIGTDLNQNMDILGKIVEGFGGNNTELVLAAIDEYDRSIAKGDPNKKVAINKGIVDSVKKFHNELVTSITNDPYLLRNDASHKDRAEVMSRISDFKEARSLYDAIRKHVSKDIVKAKESIVAEDVVKANDHMKTSVEKLFDKFADIKSRDAFFQYKYSQMYIFMVIYVQHVYQTMEKYIQDVTFINQAADEYRRNVYRELLNKILDTFVNEDGNRMDAGLNSIEDMDRFVKELAKKIDASREKQMKQLAETQNTTLKGLLEFFVRESNLDEAGLRAIADAAGSKASAVASASAPSTNTPAPALTPAGVTGFVGGANAQTGGFVKDGSIFPQAFYDL